MNAWLKQRREQLKRLVTQPVGELSRAQRRIRFWIDLSRHCWQQLNRDKATQMAASLTYYTVFSLIPVAVLSLTLFNAFKGFEDVSATVKSKAVELLGISVVTLDRPMGFDEPPPPIDANKTDEDPDPAGIDLNTPNTDAPPPTTTSTPTPSVGDQAVAADAEAQTRAQIAQSVDGLIDQLIGRISDLDFGKIGIVGLLVLIYAAINMASTVENAFNQIYKCPVSRAWHKKITVYWAALTLGPVLVAVSLYAAARVGAAFSEVPSVEVIAQLIGRFTSLGATFLVLLLVYRLMPNTNVHLKPAAVGAIVAAVLWEGAKIGFRLYVQTSFTTNALYGSLALIPLFLLWIYITWVIVLFGLELAYALQTLHSTQASIRNKEESPRLAGDPEWLIPILTQIGEAFSQGNTIGQQNLADKLGLSSRIVADFGAELVKGGLVHNVPSSIGDVSYTLARPPERIALADVLAMGRQLARGPRRDRTGPGWEYLERLAQAEMQFAQDATLASLIRAKAESRSVAAVTSDPLPPAKDPAAESVVGHG